MKTTEAGFKALYFAWVRECRGVAEEEIGPPPTLPTVDDLISWLCQRGEEYARAVT